MALAGGAVQHSTEPTRATQHPQQELARQALDPAARELLATRDHCMARRLAGPATATSSIGKAVLLALDYACRSRPTDRLGREPFCEVTATLADGQRTLSLSVRVWQAYMSLASLLATRGSRSGPFRMIAT